MLMWGAIGLALTWLKACEDDRRKREADKWHEDHAWIWGMSLLEAGEHISKWQPIVIGDDGKAYDANKCGHNG
jgi:hypothetical protein